MSDYEESPDKSQIKWNIIGRFFYDTFIVEQVYASYTEWNAPVKEEDYWNLWNGILVVWELVWPWKIGKVNKVRDIDFVIEKALSVDKRLQHAYKHFRKDLWDLNKEKLAEFKKYLAWIMKDADTVINTFEKKWTEAITRYQKTVWNFIHTVDVYASWKFEGLIRTAHISKINK